MYTRGWGWGGVGWGGVGGGETKKEKGTFVRASSEWVTTKSKQNKMCRLFSREDQIDNKRHTTRQRRRHCNDLTIIPEK